MSEYYWDNKIDYLRSTRWLYYNDDYLEFLIQKVWKINKPCRDRRLWMRIWIFGTEASSIATKWINIYWH